MVSIISKQLVHREFGAWENITRKGHTHTHTHTHTHAFASYKFSSWTNKSSFDEDIWTIPWVAYYNPTSLSLSQHILYLCSGAFSFSFSSFYISSLSSLLLFWIPCNFFLSQFIFSIPLPLFSRNLFLSLEFFLETPKLSFTVYHLFVFKLAFSFFNCLTLYGTRKW